MACCGGGMIVPPLKGRNGESRFGFAIGDHVEVVNDTHFRGWRGHVRAFSDTLLAVDLDEPPQGCKPNGQFFGPKSLRKL